MITKTITLTLGGQERVMLYGTVGYYEYIKEATGQDPFDWLDSLTKKTDGSSLTVMVEDTAAVVYAGINCQLDSTDQANIPIDRVKKWCRALPITDVQEIFKTLFSTFSSIQPGELAAQPGQGNGKQLREEGTTQ